MTSATIEIQEPIKEDSLTIFEENITAEGLEKMKVEVSNLPENAKTKEQYNAIYEAHTRFKRISVAVRKKEKTLQGELRDKFNAEKFKISGDLAFVMDIMTPLITKLSDARENWDTEQARIKQEKADAIATQQRLEFERQQAIKKYASDWEEAHEIDTERTARLAEEARLEQQRKDQEEAAARLEAERLEFEERKRQFDIADCWNVAHSWNEKIDSLMSFDDAWEEAHTTTSEKELQEIKTAAVSLTTHGVVDAEKTDDAFVHVPNHGLHKVAVIGGSEDTKAALIAAARTGGDPVLITGKISDFPEELTTEDSYSQGYVLCEKDQAPVVPVVGEYMPDPSTIINPEDCSPTIRNIAENMKTEKIPVYSIEKTPYAIDTSAADANPLAIKKGVSTGFSTTAVEFFHPNPVPTIDIMPTISEALCNQVLSRSVRPPGYQPEIEKDETPVVTVVGKYDESKEYTVKDYPGLDAAINGEPDSDISEDADDITFIKSRLTALKKFLYSQLTETSYESKKTTKAVYILNETIKQAAADFDENTAF